MQILVSTNVNYDKLEFHCFKLLKGSRISAILLVVGLENKWQLYSMTNSYGTKHCKAGQLD